MKKIWKTIGRDLWTVLLDIIAVNAAWYFALVIRFYMTNKLENLDSYMADVDTDENYEKDTEVIADGYFHESEYRSAPYFDITDGFDGITLLDTSF